MTGYPPAMQQQLALEREMAGFKVELALSLTQPWATLVAIGAKGNETRSWRTKHRGWIAIHAAKGFPMACQDLCYRNPFGYALARAGYGLPGDLQRGKVIAVALLTACYRIDSEFNRMVGEPERDFGDYTLGRFAWKLENVRRLKEPFEAKGALSLWKLPRPIVLADLA